MRKPKTNKQNKKTYNNLLIHILTYNKKKIDFLRLSFKTRIKSPPTVIKSAKNDEKLSIVNT